MKRFTLLTFLLGLTNFGLLAQTPQIKNHYLYDDAIQLAETLRELQSASDSMGQDYWDRITQLQNRRQEIQREIKTVTFGIGLQVQNLAKEFERQERIQGRISRADTLSSDDIDQIQADSTNLFRRELIKLQRNLRQLQEEDTLNMEEITNLQEKVSTQVKQKRNELAINLYEQKYRYGKKEVQGENINIKNADFASNPFIFNQLPDGVLAGIDAEMVRKTVYSNIAEEASETDETLIVDRRSEREIETDDLESNRVNLLGSQRPVQTQSASTSIIDGLSRFIIRRAKQELGVAFLQKFSESLNNGANYPELQVLFPETRSFLGRFDVENSRPLLEIAKHSFENDMVKLPSHIPELLANERISGGAKDSKGAFALSVMYEIIEKAQREIPMNTIISFMRNKVLQKYDRVKLDSYKRLQKENKLDAIIEVASRNLKQRQDSLDYTIQQLYLKVIATDSISEKIKDFPAEDFALAEEDDKSGEDEESRGLDALEEGKKAILQEVRLSGASLNEQIYYLEKAAELYQRLSYWLQPLPDTVSRQLLDAYTQDYALYFEGEVSDTLALSTLTPSKKTNILRQIHSIQYRTIGIATEDLEGEYNKSYAALSEINAALNAQVNSLKNYSIDGYRSLVFSGEVYDRLDTLAQTVQEGFEQIRPSLEDPSSDAFAFKDTLLPKVDDLLSSLENLDDAIESGVWDGDENDFYRLSTNLDQKLGTFYDLVGALGLSTSPQIRSALVLDARDLRNQFGLIMEKMPNIGLKIPVVKPVVLADSLRTLQAVYCRNFRKDTVDRKGSYQVLRFTENLYKSLDFVAPILNGFRTAAPVVEADDSTQSEEMNMRGEERWLTRNEFKDLFNDPLKRNAFLGLLYYELSSLDTIDRREALNFYPEQFFELVSRLKQQRQVIRDLRERDSTITLVEYADVVKHTLGIVNLAANVKTPNGRFLFPGLGTATKIGEQTLNLFDNVYNKNYGFAVYNMILLVDLLTTGDEEALGIEEGDKHELKLRLSRMSTEDRAAFDSKLKSTEDALEVISSQFLDAAKSTIYDSTLVSLRSSLDINLAQVQKEISSDENLKASLWDEYLYTERLVSLPRLQAITETARSEAIEEVQNKRRRRYTARREALLRYGTFMAAMLEAKTAEDVQIAVEFAALPPGSAIIKRRSPFNISLNSFFGIYGGMEKLLADSAGTDRWGGTTGLTAPIGISLNFGLHQLAMDAKQYDPLRNPLSAHRWFGSLSLFFPILDLGAVTSFRLQAGNDVALPELTFKNVIAPGAYLVYGFPRLPLSFGAGWQFGPQLRKVEVNNATISSQAFRFSAFFSVDIPIFNIYTRPAY